MASPFSPHKGVLVSVIETNGSPQRRCSYLHSYPWARGCQSCLGFPSRIKNVFREAPKTILLALMKRKRLPSAHSRRLSADLSLQWVLKLSLLTYPRRVGGFFPFSWEAWKCHLFLFISSLKTWHIAASLNLDTNGPVFFSLGCQIGQETHSFTGIWKGK